MAPTPPPHSLYGRVAAVTGAARGIGRATAQALAMRGCRVAFGDLDGGLATTAAGELGPQALGRELDVTDGASFATFLAEVEERLGPLHILVNNAGVMSVGPFVEEDELVTRRQLDVNVLGVATGMRLALPGMVARGSGHVVNVASAAGKVAIPGEAVYTATKYAVVGLTEAVRAELAGTGVELSLVLPSITNTELAAGTRVGRLSKMMEPHEVADAIVATLERPRFEVYVPASLGPTLRASPLLPRRLREALARLFETHRVAIGIDPATRAEYAQRLRREAERSGLKHPGGG
jgi:short-subunit dehydrogenase